jgi:hypothetical protein
MRAAEKRAPGPGSFIQDLIGFRFTKDGRKEEFRKPGRIFSSDLEQRVRARFPGVAIRQREGRYEIFQPASGFVIAGATRPRRALRAALRTRRAR